MQSMASPDLYTTKPVSLTSFSLPWPPTWESAWYGADPIGPDLVNSYYKIVNEEPHFEGSLKDAWTGLVQRMIDLVPTLPTPLKSNGYWLYALSPKETTGGGDWRPEQYCMAFQLHVYQWYPEAGMLQPAEAIASLNHFKAQIATHVDFSRGGVALMLKPPIREYKGHMTFELFEPYPQRVPEECKSLLNSNVKVVQNMDAMVA